MQKAVAALLCAFLISAAHAETAVKVTPYYLEHTKCGITKIKAVSARGEYVEGILNELRKVPEIRDVIDRARSDAFTSGYTLTMTEEAGCARA
jgi:hypothetical protein